MAIELTRYDVGSRDVLGEDNDATVSVADGATSTLTQDGLYLIKATTACTVRCKAGIADATGGRSFDAGQFETRYLRSGVVVACDAAA